MNSVALLACAIALVAASSCRTEIMPVVKQTVTPEYRTSAKEGCTVHDYVMQQDVPAGAENMGWVRVERQETEEATFLKLRETICAKGGNALSQPRWIREAGQSIAEAPVALEANAWKTKD